MISSIISVFKTAGIKVDENARYYKQMVGKFLDLNYSAYMGMRPKLALRNLTQQVLIMNEYGYKAYMNGRIGKYKKEVKEAMKNSDAYKLRKKDYLVVGDTISSVSDLPMKVREKMMWFYRMADLDNVETAFATGYLNAKKLHPKLTEGFYVRAGEKAIRNTQWGYGLDLPYLFKSPTGKLVGQYMSWPIWYADHLVRMVKEESGFNRPKLARTAVQYMIIAYLAEEFGIDYTRTVLFGAMPKQLGFGVTSAVNVATMLNSFGSTDTKKIRRASEEAVGNMVLGLMPGYLGAKDLKRALEGDVSGAFFYTKSKKKSKSSGGIKGIGGIGGIGGL